MFSKIAAKLLTLSFVLISFSLVAGDVKTSSKKAIKTKQGKSITTKNGNPVYIKKRAK